MEGRVRIQNGHPSKQEGAVGIIRESSWVVVLALAPSAVRVSPGMAQVGGNRFGDAVNCFRRTYHASLREGGNGEGGGKLYSSIFLGAHEAILL